MPTRFWRGSVVQGALCGLIIVAMNYGRAALAPIQDVMSRGLALSDTDIALIQGPAMAIPVVLSAAPVGLLVDRYSRARLLLILLALAIAATVATALADGFASMAASRCAIGFASAAAATTAISFLSDTFPVEQRGRATMFLAFGQMIGNSAAFASGGLFLAMAPDGPDPWRSVMLWVAGLMLLGLAGAALLDEPRRLVSTDTPLPARSRPTPCYSSVARPTRTVFGLLVAGIVTAEVAFCAVFVWAAPALDRSFLLGADVVGPILAGAFLASGAIGPLLGGFLVERLQRIGGLRTVAMGIAGLQLLSLPLCMFGFLPSAIATVGLLVTFLVIVNATLIMGMALFTLVIPEDVRGFATGLLFAAEALVGMGFAPIVVSELSDAAGGGTAVRGSIAMVAATANFLGVIILCWAVQLLPRTKAMPLPRSARHAASNAQRRT